MALSNSRRTHNSSYLLSICQVSCTVLDVEGINNLFKKFGKASRMEEVFSRDAGKYASGGCREG